MLLQGTLLPPLLTNRHELELAIPARTFGGYFAVADMDGEIHVAYLFGADRDIE